MTAVASPRSLPESMLGVSAPMRLLLACLVWPVDDAAQCGIRAAADALGDRVVDWSDFPALAARHRVEALVDHALRRAGATIPAAVSQRLGARAMHSSFLEMACAREAVALCGRLSAGGLHPLLLKGAATAVSGYGRLGLKASRDIDLLVPPDEVERSLTLLEEAGYVARPGETPRDPRWRRHHKDTELFRAGSPVVVELHWRLFDNPALDPRRGDDRPLALSLYPGGDVRTLGQDAFFAYLCLHGAQHAWSRLKWLAEFDAFVSSVDAADRARLYAAATGRQARLAAAQALILRARLLGKPAPVETERLYASSRRLRWLVKLAAHSALAGGSVEIEDQQLGSTPKNVSHYLLVSSVRYWVNELGYDIRDDRASSEKARRFGAVGRMASWLWRLPAVLRQADSGRPPPTRQA